METEQLMHGRERKPQPSTDDGYGLTYISSSAANKPTGQELRASRFELWSKQSGSGLER